MGINEKIDEIIQQAKQEKVYIEASDIFEQDIYGNAIYFMLRNPNERSCSNCQYQHSRELLRGKILESKIGGIIMIEDIILFVKKWWKQNITCRHKELGIINFDECGRIKNYIG